MTFQVSDVEADPELSKADDAEPTRLRELKFEVVSALKSPFFEMVKEDSVPKRVLAKTSVTARCVICGPEVSDRHKLIKVTVQSTSNLSRHLRKHHAPKTVHDFKKWLAEHRSDFVRGKPALRDRMRLRRRNKSSTLS